jgi:hypothetical protein
MKWEIHALPVQHVHGLVEHVHTFRWACAHVQISTWTLPGEHVHSYTSASLFQYLSLAFWTLSFLPPPPFFFTPSPPSRKVKESLSFNMATKIIYNFFSAQIWNLTDSFHPAGYVTSQPHAIYLRLSYYICIIYIYIYIYITNIYIYIYSYKLV